MVQTIRRVSIGLLALALLIVLAQNAHDVSVQLLGWTFSPPLLFLIGGSVLVGAALTVLILGLVKGRNKLRERH